MTTSVRSSGTKHADTVQPSWRNFSFFNVRPTAAREPAPLPPSLPRQGIAHVAYIAPNAEGWAGPRGSLVVGLSDGQVRVLDAYTYTECASWKAHEDVLHTVCVARDVPAIVSVGSDGPHTHPRLCVWRLHAGSERHDPVLSIQVRLQHGPRSVPVSVIDVHPKLAFVAAGFEDGKVLLIRDVAATAAEGGQLRVKVARDASTMDEPEQEQVPDKVTGLAFVHVGEHVQLLIATISKTLKYTVLGSGAGGPPAVIDSIGCASGCSAKFLAIGEEALDLYGVEVEADATTTPSTPSINHKLVLARDEAIYVVGVEGRETSIALEGPKVGLFPLHGQLVVLSTPTKHGMGIDRPVSLEGVPQKPAKAVQLTVFDLDTKCVTYTAILGAGVEALWTSSSDALAFSSEPAEFVSILTPHEQLFRLEGKTLKDMLEQLFRSNLYLLAVQLVRARAIRFPHARLPMLTPSAMLIPLRPQDRRVVAPADMLIADIYRRYGDHLYANSDFEGAMLQFIKTIGVVSPGYVIRKFLDAQRLQFLTRYLQALHTRGLANADHTTLLLNCFTKLHDTDALDRFIHAPHTRAAENAPAPERERLTFDVDVAITVCRRGGCTAQAAYLAKTYGHHEEYLDIQLRDAHNTMEAIRYLSELSPALTELYVQQYAHILLDTRPQEATQLLIELCTRPITQNGTSYVPSPAPLFSHFVGHEAMLTHFCEQLACRRWNKVVQSEAGTPQSCQEVEAEPDEVLVFDTLLELYLTSAKAPNKALNVLYNPARYPYTIEHAFILCTTEECTPGLLFLYERLGMVDAIVQHWVAESEHDASGASAALLAAVDTFGRTHPEVYISVLQFLVSKAEVLVHHRQDFLRLLDHVDQQGLLSPIEVVQLVSSSDAVELGMMREYLLRHVRDERAETDGIKKLIHSYETEITEKEAELAKLSSDDAPVVFQNDACNLCHGALTLPSVHFMCKHSFHLHCLPDGKEARECPLCSHEHDTLRELQQSQALLGDYNVVLNEVHEADDGFDAIAELFSKQIVR